MPNAIDDDEQTHEPLWKKSDVARFCGVRQRTIENWMNCGLPYIRLRNVVRFKPADVRDFLDVRRRIVRDQ